MVGRRHSGPRKAIAPPLGRRQAWWDKHRRPISRLTVTWRQKSSEPCASKEEVIEANEEEAKAIVDFLMFMAGHGGRAPMIVCAKYVMNFVQFIGKVFKM